MRSMTGYGRGECNLHNRRFIVELRAVNHKYNDITVKMPRNLICFEDAVKKILNKEIFRGKVDVYISFESFSEKDISVKLNEVLADDYFSVLTLINKRYGLKREISAVDISKMPDVLSIEKNADFEEEKLHIWEVLKNAAEEALRSFLEMRETEGESLKENIKEKLIGISDYVLKISERAPFVAQEYKNRLKEKLSSLEEIDADESRILTEVLIFSDKACIDEELTRLKSHIEQMKKILEQGEPIGKKLDFLVQEMNREVNTIGSKANDLDITSYVVELKSEIEKIREQVQNIE